MSIILIIISILKDVNFVCKSETSEKVFRKRIIFIITDKTRDLALVF